MSDPSDPGGAAIALSFTDEQDRSVDADGLARLARHALEALGVSGGADLGVAFVTPERIAELKREHFGDEAVTDVLSFPLDDPGDPMPGPTVLGDVVICPAAAERQARGLGLDPAGEMRQLLVHGILHVLGRDHADPRAERAMRAEERRILGSFREGAAA